ncbi:UNVERIFIED_CONTAM: hypothetical protein FKN15_026117 [Acipenser sinensis]
MVSVRSAEIAETKALLKGLQLTQSLGTPRGKRVIMTDPSFWLQAYDSHSLAWKGHGYSDHMGKPIAHANIWRDTEKVEGERNQCQACSWPPKRGKEVMIIGNNRADELAQGAVQGHQNLTLPECLTLCGPMSDQIRHYNFPFLVRCHQKDVKHRSLVIFSPEKAKKTIQWPSETDRSQEEPREAEKNGGGSEVPEEPPAATWREEKRAFQDKWENAVSCITEAIRSSFRASCSLTATTPALTREGEDEYRLSSEVCAVSRPLLFTMRTHHAATEELQRRRTTQLSGSLQASPQVPGQTTGVAGARGNAAGGNAVSKCADSTGAGSSSLGNPFSRCTTGSFSRGNFGSGNAAKGIVISGNAGNNTAVSRRDDSAKAGSSNPSKSPEISS